MKLFCKEWKWPRMRKPGTLTIMQSADAFYTRAAHAEETQEANACVWERVHIQKCTRKESRRPHNPHECVCVPRVYIHQRDKAARNNHRKAAAIKISQLWLSPCGRNRNIMVKTKRVSICTLGAAVCALFVLLCAAPDYFSVSAEQISCAIYGSIVCIPSIGAHGVIAVAICGTMRTGDTFKCK
jgi:hypothetical protein